MEWGNLLSSERFGEEAHFKGEEYFLKYEDRYKTEFEKDYQTIISSASFRRLQDKTQVFPLEKNDFIRTRLTHSIETSTLAKKLGNMVLENIKNEKYKKERCYKDYEKYKEQLQAVPEILACAGLLHDIGNPPFGHFGEITMSDWFKDNLKMIRYKDDVLSNYLSSYQIQDLYHLEGNAQALRVVGRLHFLDSDYGMNLTKSLLNVLVKYPTTSLHIDKNSSDIRFHKLGYYINDYEYYKEIAKSTGIKLEDGSYARHPLTFLLEAADDIAYATADLEDAFKKGFFTLNEFVEYYKGQIDENDNQKVIQLMKELEEDLPKTNKLSKGEQLQKIQIWLNKVRNWLMYTDAYGFVKNYDEILDGTYNKELMTGVYHEKTLKILKGAAVNFVFNHVSITKVELSGSVILSFLLDKFIHAILYYDTELEKNMTREDKKLVDLLPDNYMENYKFEKIKYKGEAEELYLRIHLVIDYICGMTDSYAKRLYQELNGISIRI